jgi:hypothetical protein
MPDVSKRNNAHCKISVGRIVLVLVPDRIATEGPLRVAFTAVPHEVPNFGDHPAEQVIVRCLAYVRTPQVAFRLRDEP